MENKYEDKIKSQTANIEFGASPDFMKKQFDENVVPTSVKQDAIPEFIKREMKFFILWNLFTTLLNISAITVLTLRYTIPALEEDSLALLVPLLLLSVFLGYRVLTSLLSISEIKSDKQIVKAESRMGTTIVPSFLAKGYRKLRVRTTNVNWVAFTSYAILGVIIFLHQLAIDEELIWPNFAGIIIIDYKYLSTDSWTRTVELFQLILIIMVVVHIFVLVSTRRRLHKIDTFYGYEIISNQEIDQLKVHANKRNRRILIVSLIVIFFVIWIPFRIIRGRRK